METASDIMTRSPITGTVRQSMAEAAQLLFANDIRHLPVIDGDRLVGMLSDRDLRAWMGPWTNHALREDFNERIRTPVGEVMSSNLITVHPDATLGDAIRLFLDHRIGAAPVIERRTCSLIGIISYVDLLRATLEYTDV